MFVYIYVCVHICLQALNNLYYTINQTFIKNNQKGFQTYMFLCFSAYGFTNSQI